MNPGLDSAKKKKRFAVILIVVLCVVYVLCAVRPLSREIHFIPVWTIDAYKNTKNDKLSERLSEADASAFEGAIAYKMGQTAGYFTRSGIILSSVTFPYKAVISQSCYSLYDTHSSRIPVYSPDGAKIAEIKQTGFPYFDGGRTFQFLPGGSSFSRLSEDCSVEWTYEGFAPITAFSSSDNGVLVGFADGNLILFGPDGKKEFDFAPGGSDIPVILGAGLSASGKYIASVSGQGGQRFVLAEKRNGMASAVCHKTLEKETTKQVIVKFSRNEDYVYYSYAGGLGIVDCGTHKHSTILIEGNILSIQEDSDGTIFVLSRLGKNFTVSVVEPFDVYSGSFSFDAETAFMSVRDGSLFVGHDSKISRIDIRHK